jgi:hypothetical protein
VTSFRSIKTVGNEVDIVINTGQKQGNLGKRERGWENDVGVLGLKRRLRGRLSGEKRGEEFCRSVCLSPADQLPPFNYNGPV